MKRSRLSEEQIIGILKEHQAGASAADLCRKYGISDATFYKYKAKFGAGESRLTITRKVRSELILQLFERIDIQIFCGQDDFSSLLAHPRNNTVKN